MITETKEFTRCIPAHVIDKLTDRNPGAKLSANDDFYRIDEKGRQFISMEDVQKLRDRNALEKHGNDPYIRLSDCGFPKDKESLEFALTYNFGLPLQEILQTFTEEKKWCWLWGGHGLGKTSLAIRAAWEMIKPYPCRKAVFLKMQRYIRECVNTSRMTDQFGVFIDYRGKPVVSGICNLVILDDFDKVNLDNPHICRSLLDLTDYLQEKKCFVIVTSQIELLKLAKKHQNNYDIYALLDRFRGASRVFDKFEGKSRR